MGRCAVKYVDSCQETVDAVGDVAESVLLSHGITDRLREAFEAGMEPRELVRSVLMSSMDLMRRGGFTPTESAIQLALHLGTLSVELEQALETEPDLWEVPNGK